MDMDMDTKVLRVATACMVMAGRRKEDDLTLLMVLARDTFMSGRDSVKQAIRPMMAGTGLTQPAIYAAMDRLTGQGVVHRVRPSVARGASTYSIDLPALMALAEPHHDSLKEMLAVTSP